MAQKKGSAAGSEPKEPDYILRAAKSISKGVNSRADAYLSGEYDPKKEARKHLVKGTTTALVVLSLLTGLAFQGPADITEEQAAANYRPAPIVMDVDDFVNAPVDDEDDADEEKGSRLSFVARFRQAVLSLPQSVRLLIITPLWAIGTALMTMISFLWNVIFTSPLGAFIASLAMGFLVLLGTFTATAKMLFPDIPLNKLLSKRNLLILGVTACILSIIDAAAPLYWHQYPLAAALIKIVFGGTVIGILSVKTRNLFNKIQGLPPLSY
ncbi:MAG: hypothetical protein IJI11_02645 [Mogibacterium sp.]|nr:hypothetical protein [Mogibacterium sp.]